MIWKIQACKTILRHSRCQRKPKTQPHLHMCPSVCFYTLFFQPVGEVVFIQEALWSFFFTHPSPLRYRDAYFNVLVMCLWTHICHSLGWVSASLLEGELILAGLRGAAAAPSQVAWEGWVRERWLPCPGCRTPPSAAGRPSCRRRSPGRAGENASALGLLSGESGKSCVNRGRITKNEPLQLWALGAIWGWIC